MIDIGHHGSVADLHAWQRVRRYAVPGWMIAECTAARERGDWRAACEAAGIEVGFDDPGPLAGLLAGFAPDLLRWHLPRILHGSTGLLSHQRYVLAPEGEAGTVLLVRTYGNERLTLDLMNRRQLPPGANIVVPPHLWDARRAMGLREPATFEPQPGPAPGWAAQLFVKSGWAVERERPGADGQLALLLRSDLLRPPVDLTLVRAGLLAVDAVHPLVRRALFPEAAPVLPLTGSGLPADVLTRVRCRGVWHWAGVSAGRIELPEHTAEEQQREHALAAFGGTISGCFQAERAWNGGGGRLPRLLREYRRDLILRLEHGGAREVTGLLDAGLDPLLRDAGGRTLIHMLRTFGDPGLLPRLIAAGVGIDTEDRQGYTALYEAVQHRWPSRYIIAMVDAGATLGRLSSTRFLDVSAHRASDDLQTAIAYIRKKKR
ncbi:hypothetical protein [Actinoplanes couchii]|uniref:Ankyrin n=1 Tax=Actinoplanes couchii TaxID=403638 RepID=A0ABQ3XHM5_9ACTN|nr:hypothetical protein [Actinoplanes couchii]MDR6317622.1 hypothetical protein [Actinoplanes couchii]GID58007.1 hypothetical protein Aco03nite_064110 [Actinoplanes couchii]